MKIKTPINRKKIRTHITYNFWKYILVIAAAVFGWDLLYSMTAYKSPEDKRIDLYIQSPLVTEQRAEAFFQPIWEERVPDMEVVDAVMLTSSTQDYYGSMQLTVYIMAQEGDIYMLSSSDFKSFASQGVFLDLQPAIDEGKLHTEGLDLSAGYVALIDDNGLPTGERQLFGIPAASLGGLAEGLGLDTRDMVLSVTAFSGNEENVIRFLDGLIAAGKVQ